MPISRRFRNPALLFASLAFAAVGCAGPSSRPDLVLPEVVIVLVEYDAATGKATVTPKEIRLKEQKQFAKWVSCDGLVQVEFNPADTPFEHPPTATAAAGPARASTEGATAQPPAVKKHSVNSEKPKKGSHREKPYEYDAFLVLADGTRVKADPRIIIDP